MTFASFTLRGHATGDPRLLLGTLVTIDMPIDMPGLAFRIGAVAPMARAAGRASRARAGRLAHDFGAKALWIVAMPFVAGALILVLLGAMTAAAPATPQGQAFALKPALFAGGLALAAISQLRLAPKLASAIPGAGRRLGRSIGLQAAPVAVILATTAAPTAVASPPTEQARIAPGPPRTVQIVSHASGEEP